MRQIVKLLNYREPYPLGLRHVAGHQYRTSAFSRLLKFSRRSELFPFHHPFQSFNPSTSISIHHFILRPFHPHFVIIYSEFFDNTINVNDVGFQIFQSCKFTSSVWGESFFTDSCLFQLPRATTSFTRTANRAPLLSKFARYESTAAGGEEKVKGQVIGIDLGKNAPMIPR